MARPPRKPKPPRPASPDARKGASEASYTLTDLEQVKVLADPLRMRILAAFADEESTTKQVAQRLGEPPTRLYHHVEALERVGLLRLTRKRQNRGTTEKYYSAVARMIRADPRLFSSAAVAPAAGATLDFASGALETTAEEMRRLAAEGASGLGGEGQLAFLELHGSAAEMRKLRARLERLLASLAPGTGPVKAGAAERRWRLTLAFFPLD